MPIYSDIISRIIEPPLWWNAHGVPRWCEFAPIESANSLAREVVLIQIACQGCGQALDEELNWSEHSRRHNGERLEPLSSPARLKEFHYRDPPDAGCCLVGPTMNWIDLRILQFWTRGFGKWERCPELELEFGKLEDYFENHKTKF